MPKAVRPSAVHGLCVAAVLTLAPTNTMAQTGPDGAGSQVFPVLPLPPAIEGLIGMPQTYTAARSTYLALITQRG